MTVTTIATKKLTLGAVARLRDKVDRLNNRAARLGLEPLTITVGPAVPVKRESPCGVDYTVWFCDTEVSGVAPRINGWEIVARIEFTDSGNLVHVAPHIESVDNKYRTIGNECHHCNTKRRRNDLVVIRHSDGREKVVGRNCLADFIRTDDAEGLLLYAAYSAELSVSDCDEDEDYRGGRVKPIETPENDFAGRINLHTQARLEV